MINKFKKINLFIMSAFILMLNTSCVQDSNSNSDNTENTTNNNITTTITDTSKDTTSIMTTTTLQDAINLKVQSILDTMSLEEKIYQMFIVTPEDLSNVDVVTQADDTTKTYLEKYPVGGIIYFSSNFETDTQTKNMISTTQQYMMDINGIGLFMCVDEEGGKVSRLYKSLGTTTELNPMEYYGENANPTDAYEIGSTLGKDLSQYGLNVDFAPVSDVDLNTNNGLHELGRCFSDNPETVALMVENVVKGIQDNNVSACIKHFPGLGSTNADTHDGSVAVDRTKEQFENIDFIPIKAGIDANVDFVMVSHMTINGITDNLPCDLSKTIVSDWLRNDLNFEGIAITDSHQMGAITDEFSNGKSSVMAIQSGIDIILMPEDLSQSFDAIYQAVQNGEISENRIDESVIRILTQKEKLKLLS